MSRPRFSLIIPAHNEEHYIEQCLQSVGAQTFTDFETILVADRCTDRTEELARNLGYTPISAEAGSLGRARNVGMDLAQGEYILFLDSDDYYLSRDALRVLDSELARAPVDVLAFGFMFGPRLARPLRGAGNAIWPNVWSKAWRRSVFGDLRFGDEITAEDVGWNEIALPIMRSFGALDVPLIQYRYPREGSLTSRVLAGELSWGQMPDVPPEGKVWL